MTDAVERAEDTQVLTRLSFTDQKLIKLNRSIQVTIGLSRIDQQVEKLCRHRTPEYFTSLTNIGGECTNSRTNRH